RPQRGGGRPPQQRQSGSGQRGAGGGQRGGGARQAPAPANSAMADALRRAGLLDPKKGRG
ncbi:hypothetical protein ABZ614_22785, partial [Streptomyces sp. NPDC013178]